MRFLSFVSVAVFCGFVAALPTDSNSVLVPRDCSAEIQSLNLARREKRGHAKRVPSTNLASLSCVAAPETPLKDYSRPPLQSVITGGQTGLSMTLDVAVVDVTTCQPLPNVMVEVWSPNALGNYGSFLRGASTSASNGVAEFQTIFPGYPSGAANHINLMIHTSSSMSGTVSHVGQVFFTDRWTDVVSMTSPYDQNTHSRMLNSADPTYSVANSQGYNAIIDIQSIHDDWPEGVVGYITVGVDPSKTVNVSL